jgi:predicted DNA-binding antitoxin AbrB/MazE fold protein
LLEGTVMTTVLAVYENGVLRPAHPLPFAEGETVEVTVAKPQTLPSPVAEDEVTRRLRAAKSIEEWVAATRLLPPDDGGYDIVEALNDNRIWSGELPRHSAGGNAP